MYLIKGILLSITLLGILGGCLEQGQVEPDSSGASAENASLKEDTALGDEEAKGDDLATLDLTNEELLARVTRVIILVDDDFQANGSEFNLVPAGKPSSTNASKRKSLPKRDLPQNPTQTTTTANSSEPLHGQPSVLPPWAASGSLVGTLGHTPFSLGSVIDPTKPTTATFFSLSHSGATFTVPVEPLHSQDVSKLSPLKVGSVDLVLSSSAKEGSRRDPKFYLTDDEKRRHVDSEPKLDGRTVLTLYGVGPNGKRKFLARKFLGPDLVDERSGVPVSSGFILNPPTLIRTDPPTAEEKVLIEKFNREFSPPPA